MKVPSFCSMGTAARVVRRTTMYATFTGGLSETSAVGDIAATLRCSAGAVKNRLSVARDNLRQLLEGQL